MSSCTDCLGSSSGTTVESLFYVKVRDGPHHSEKGTPRSKPSIWPWCTDVAATYAFKVEPKKRCLYLMLQNTKICFIVQSVGLCPLTGICLTLFEHASMLELLSCEKYVFSRCVACWPAIRGAGPIWWVEGIEGHREMSTTGRTMAHYTELGY